LEGKKTAIREMARETKGEAVEMVKTYLADEEEALDGFEFLSMAEAGELCVAAGCRGGTALTHTRREGIAAAGFDLPEGVADLLGGAEYGKITGWMRSEIGAVYGPLVLAITGAVGTMAREEEDGILGLTLDGDRASRHWSTASRCSPPPPSF
jgi:hypothetical protein